MVISSSVSATNIQTLRVIKCPMTQCPGSITLDSTRNQTGSCRYCRASVNTLRFLLSRVGAEHKVLPPHIHDEFNHLMLAMASAKGCNVYLRPSRETLVDWVQGAKGMAIQFNPTLGTAGRNGVAALIGTVLHKLLHFKAHLDQGAPRVEVRGWAVDKQRWASLLSYLVVVADHAWVTSRLRQLYPLLYSAQAQWGLDIAQMLSGSESMFNRNMSQRNLKLLLDKSQEVGDDAEAFYAAVLNRLAVNTSHLLDYERGEARRAFIAVQSANVRLLNADVFPEYQAALAATGLEDVPDSMLLGEQLYNELKVLSATTQGEQDRELGTLDPVQFRRTLESGIEVLGMSDYFDVAD